MELQGHNLPIREFGLYPPRIHRRREFRKKPNCSFGTVHKIEMEKRTYDDRSVYNLNVLRLALLTSRSCSMSTLLPSVLSGMYGATDNASLANVCAKMLGVLSTKYERLFSRFPIFELITELSSTLTGHWPYAHPRSCIAHSLPHDDRHLKHRGE